MNFNQRPLSLAIASLLLGALMISCGNSGDSTISRKKSQETTVRSTRAIKLKDQGPQGGQQDRSEQPSLSLQAMEPVREGKNFLNKQKLAEAALKEDNPSEPSPKPLGRRQRRALARKQAQQSGNLPADNYQGESGSQAEPPILPSQ